MKMSGEISAGITWIAFVLALFFFLDDTNTGMDLHEALIQYLTK